MSDQPNTDKRTVRERAAFVAYCTICVVAFTIGYLRGRSDGREKTYLEAAHWFDRAYEWGFKDGLKSKGAPNE